MATLLQDVRVDHRRSYVLVAQQCLYGPDVSPSL